MKQIGLKEQFELTFKVNRDGLNRIERMMKDNPIFYRVCQTEFCNIVQLRFRTNIRQAEIIRQLLKNITVYE